MPVPSAEAIFITRLEGGDAGGVRLAVKDCIDVAGVPTTNGSPAVAASAGPAERDAACLGGARAAGVRIVGKANLHELCFGITGVNPWFGTPENPLDPARVPGGSSSGPAVAVAVGEADVAFGTDTTGSLRNPAACCGVVGLRTTHGRVPLAGVQPLAPSLDTVGPMGVDVAAVRAGAALLDPGLAADRAVGGVTVGRLRGIDADPVIDAAVDAALAEAELRVVEVTVPGWDAAVEAGRTILFAEAWEHLGALYLGQPGLIGGDVAARLESARRLGAEDVAAARRAAVRWQAEVAELFRRVDVWALPTLAGFPPLISDDAAPPNALAIPASTAGLPALSLPVAAAGPLPAGLQLVGPADSEPLLLAVAAHVESANPWRPLR